MPPIVPVPEPPAPPMPWGVRIWFGWAFALLAFSGLLLPRIIEYVDFSERAPFSLLGLFMMVELAAVIFGVTVAMQRKRIAWRFAVGIAMLPAPMLAGLPPILLEFPDGAAAGWQALWIPVGVAITVVLLIALLRRSSRAYFSED